MVIASEALIEHDVCVNDLPGVTMRRLDVETASYFSGLISIHMNLS